MMEKLSNIAVLVPALNPDEGFERIVDGFAALGFGLVVAVDDGSRAEARHVFDAIEAKPSCKVLRHEVNRGKGAALKTGLGWIAANMPGVEGVVTADADGQHSPADCGKVALAMREGPRAICLGSRSFAGRNVPMRSRIGNWCTSLVFFLLHGTWLLNTQTGLRAFPVEDIPMMVGVPGDRFEYEMAVLSEATRRGVALRSVPIETIYENGNASSHFRPLIDSVRICRAMLTGFVRYAGVSLSSFVLDQGLAWLFVALLPEKVMSAHAAIWASGFTARLASSAYNYVMNRSFVFGDGGPVARSAWRYAVLCVAAICASNAFVTGLSILGVPRGAAKLVVDTVIYFACYAFQSKWVFGGRMASPCAIRGGK